MNFSSSLEHFNPFEISFDKSSVCEEFVFNLVVQGRVVDHIDNDHMDIRLDNLLDRDSWSGPDCIADCNCLDIVSYLGYSYQDTKYSLPLVHSHSL